MPLPRDASASQAVPSGRIPTRTPTAGTGQTNGPAATTAAATLGNNVAPQRRGTPVTPIAYPVTTCTTYRTPTGSSSTHRDTERLW